MDLTGPVVGRVAGLAASSAVAVARRLANRRFAFALTALAVVGAKIVHVASHASAVPAAGLYPWAPALCAQDTALLVLVLLLLRVPWRLSGRAACSWHLARPVLAALVVAIVVAVAVADLVFFLVSGGEIRWRNVTVAGDAAGRALLLSGLMTLLVLLAALGLAAWLLQDALSVAGAAVVDVIAWPLLWIRRRLRPERYAELAQQDDGLDDKAAAEPTTTPRSRRVAGAVVAVQLVLYLLRPRDGALTYLAWTPPLLPLVELLDTAAGLVAPPNWNATTALTSPVPLPWLPKDAAPAGFEDWYDDGATHYNAAADPLHISNLDEPLLEELRGRLGDVSIRHVVVVALESTRKDVFPIKANNNSVVERLRASWGARPMPDEAMDRLRTLTPTAKHLTGELDDGFTPAGPADRPRGGVSFNNAYTAATYTLKSLTGLLCGAAPVPADFNVEAKHHLYQPCLPQLLDVLGGLDADAKWRSLFMQTATLDFDGFGDLMAKMGFPRDGGLIDRDYLRAATAKFGAVTLPDVNYFGFVEEPLEDYIRDAFQSAWASGERVFLTQVTSTSHHPWALPSEEEPVRLAHGLDNLSNYANAIGYDDRWLAKVLGMLDDLGVANETLVVLAGDHGMPVGEHEHLHTYYDPSAVNNHVPLVLSHPSLPPVTVDDAVSLQQVVPTVLDLLVETGSLSEAASRAASDLRRNYEGQSLVRRQRRASARGVANLQFTNVNPGGAMMCVRDARHAGWRLVVPLIANTEWRFVDLGTDPGELRPVLAFDFDNFLSRVGEAHGAGAAEWVREAVPVTQWYVDDVRKRWRYGSYAP